MSAPEQALARPPKSQPEPQPKISRRDALKIGVGAAATLGLGGGLAAFLERGNRPQEPAISGYNPDTGGGIPATEKIPTVTPSPAKDSPTATATMGKTATLSPVTTEVPKLSPAAPTASPTLEPRPTDTPGASPTKDATSMPQAKELDWETMSPEEMRERVKNNIEAFMKLPAKDLVRLSAGAPFAMQYANGLRPYPLFHDVAGSGIDTYLGKPDDPEHHFPCVTAITNRPRTPAIGDNSAILLTTSAINLGQQTVAVETSKGLVRMRLGRVGYFAGDPESKSGITRGTYPVFYGWDTDANSKVTKLLGGAYSESDFRSGPSQSILYPLTPAPGGTFAENMTSLGRHIADGVVVNNLGATNTPSADLQQRLGARGYPPELFGDWLKNNYLSIQKLNNIFTKLTLDQARRDGYVLYDAGRPDTVKSSIPNLLNGKTREQLISELPFNGKHITTDTMTLEELSQIPWATYQWVFITSDPLIK